MLWGLCLCALSSLPRPPSPHFVIPNTDGRAALRAQHVGYFWGGAGGHGRAGHVRCLPVCLAVRPGLRTLYASARNASLPQLACQHHSRNTRARTRASSLPRNNTRIIPATCLPSCAPMPMSASVAKQRCGVAGPQACGEHLIIRWASQVLSYQPAPAAPAHCTDATDASCEANASNAASAPRPSDQSATEFKGSNAELKALLKARNVSPGLSLPMCPHVSPSLFVGGLCAAGGLKHSSRAEQGAPKAEQERVRTGSRTGSGAMDRQEAATKCGAACACVSSRLAAARWALTRPGTPGRLYRSVGQ